MIRYKCEKKSKKNGKKNEKKIIFLQSHKNQTINNKV